ncbi:AtpZ/AtpI family protein [Nocardioides cavernaquae]|uniref:AtpZ/AtpI family protein n=1 Tax=Nocardioides cavernaquae TaxID=2321396 RepID=UPI0015FEF573|nr:AtpZ/AtpI family protein [Nocardioides cavernaquae]
MAQQDNPSAQPTEKSPGDPWHAFGYLMSGVILYGIIGWGLDRWAGTDFLVGIGIVFGAVLGIFMTWRRFLPAPHAPAAPNEPQHDQHSDEADETQEKQ